jgi:hypothetical protein
MKCKDLNIEPCFACIANRKIGCWISVYKTILSIHISKKYILEFNPVNPYYYNHTLKHYYPDFYDWKQKMLILK